MFKMLKTLARASQEANKETEQWRKGFLKRKQGTEKWPCRCSCCRGWRVRLLDPDRGLGSESHHRCQTVVILCKPLLLQPPFSGHTASISIHFCLKWWQREFWAPGEPLFPNPTHRTAYLKHSMTSVHWGHTLKIFHQKIVLNTREQSSKQTTRHTPTQNVFIVRNLLFRYKAWTLPHTKHFCMFTTPATHFRGGWGLYITTLTCGMASKPSTTHIFPWAILILKAGAQMTAAQPWQHLFSGWNKSKAAFKVISLLHPPVPWGCSPSFHDR